MLIGAISDSIPCLWVLSESGLPLTCALVWVRPPAFPPGQSIFDVLAIPRLGSTGALVLIKVTIP
jgi:hypothetical protein